jgi:phage shock protein PspC (stress-responsive transcriptional regulator)
MKKVVTINLNGNAYQVDEDGYALIDEYLRDAAATLAGNPDINEIMSDLERAVADKFHRFLRPDKNVVSSAEVRETLAEMGPVDPGLDPAGDGGDREHGAASSGTPRGPDAGSTGPEPRRLYRLKDEGMIEGVCAGLGAYLGIDPTLVRILFVVLLVMTAGTAGTIYILFLAFVPVARTPEEKAAAYGAPFNAQDVLNQAKSKFEDFTSDEGRESWKRHWRAQRRYWQRHGHEAGDWLPFLLLFFGLFWIVSFLVNATPARIGPNVLGNPPFVQVGLPILLILVGVSVVFARRGGAGVLGRTLSTVMGLSVVLFLFWFAFTTIPPFQVWVNRLVGIWCRAVPWGCG